MNQGEAAAEKLLDLEKIANVVLPGEEDTRTYWEIKDLTSIEISLSDAQGALLSVLEIFRNHKINMTRIVSKPSK